MPSVLTPYAEGIKLGLAVLVGCLLLWAGQTVLEWREAAQQNDQRGRTMEATSGITQDGTRADEDRAGVDADIASGRSQYHDTYEEATRHEPETAARSDRSVPPSVRNAFRARRLARERSGCAGEQCGSRPPPEDAPQR